MGQLPSTKWWIGIVVGCLALATTPVRGQDLNGFFPEKGEGDVAISYSWDSYDHFFLGTRRVEDPGLGKVTTKSATLWLRYGVTDRFALIANVPYVDADSDGAAGFSAKDFQDLSVLADLRLASHRSASGWRLVLAGAVGARTPTVDYVANAPVSVGDGTTDGLLRLVVQLERGGFYLSQQVGYDLRGGDAPDGFPLYTELGITRGQLTWSGFYNVYIANGGTDIGDPGFTFPSNKEEFQRLGVKLFARLTGRVGVAVTGYTTLDGRNTGDTTGYSLSGVFRF